MFKGPGLIAFDVGTPAAPWSAQLAEQSHRSGANCFFLLEIGPAQYDISPEPGRVLLTCVDSMLHLGNYFEIFQNVFVQFKFHKEIHCR